MKKEWVLTQEAFDGLLDWLDPDREQAARKYEAIRMRLIKIFVCRSCREAEELADETINRVSAKVREVAGGYIGDPALYFYQVSKMVHFEYRRKCRDRQNEMSVDSAERELKAPMTSLTDDIESEYECLERCLDRLPTDSRKLVLGYYQQDRKAKIEHRKRLAMELGIAVNALRIRAHRIRLVLQQCVHDCLEEQPAN
jgi:DNA-directed RNA polymerase specialized sigma24 family protein